MLRDYNTLLQDVVTKQCRPGETHRPVTTRRFVDRCVSGLQPVPARARIDQEKPLHHRLLDGHVSLPFGFVSADRLMGSDSMSRTFRTLGFCPEGFLPAGVGVLSVTTVFFTNTTSLQVRGRCITAIAVRRWGQRCLEGGQVSQCGVSKMQTCSHALCARA